MKFAIVGVSAALLAACSGGAGTMDGIMASWRGATAEDAFRQWGYPHEERVIAGHRLLVWHRDVQLTSPVVANTTGSVGAMRTFQATTTYSGGHTASFGCDRFLEIDGFNRITSATWEGSNCPFLEAGPYSNWRRKS